MNASTSSEKGPTLIAVLASHDSPAKHLELAETLQKLITKREELLKRFHFVFTGGTFRRLVLGEGCPDSQDEEKGLEVNDDRFVDVRRFLLERSTALPDRAGGGLVLLSNLVIHHQCELLWLFLSPDTAHWVNCQNMALLRLSDTCFAKKYMNGASVRRWADEEAERDVDRCPQSVDPLIVHLGTPEKDPEGLAPWPRFEQTKDSKEDNRASSGPQEEDKEKSDRWPDNKDLSIALIAHDEMKTRMVDFATQYERELKEFKRILTTGTTGTEIRKRCHDLRSGDKICLCQSGPYGGDLEIAAEVLYGRCQVVVFFVDALNPHPHIDDIRVVFSVCMMPSAENSPLILSNEIQAREWFDTVRFLSCAERAATT